MIDRTTLLAATVALAATCAFGACASNDDETATDCATIVHDASLAIDVDEQIRRLDDALRSCRSYAALQAEMSRYPGIVGYDVTTYVELRCTTASPVVQRGPTCRSLTAPSTTAPPTTIAELVFVGETLDGRLIELRAPEVEFVGDVPAAIQQIADAALTTGCQGVADQRAYWSALVADPVYSDEASVYAKHADNVARYFNCPP